MNVQVASPAPKPSRLERLLAKDAARKVRRQERVRASRNKQRTSYGRRDGEESWPQFKARILARDGHKCVLECVTRPVGVTVHHVRTVGSGGKNDERNAVSLCAWCHQYVHDGAISRNRLEMYVDSLYPPTPSLFADDDERDGFTEGLTATDGRKGA